jgi:16S rRNA (cytosine967-C5)-methyltransferase
VNPRVAAHTIIAAAGRGTFADRTAEEVLPRVALHDRGLALEIAYGVLRLRARLDCRIDALTDRPLKRIDADLLDWLRAGIYELTEMRTPAHAAVNENVKQARRAGAGAATGFLNAVLRRAAKEDSTPFPERREDPVGFFSTYGSHPEWLVKRWLARCQEHEVAALVEHGNSPPPVVIRMLEEASEDAVAAACPEGVRLEAIGAWPGSYRLAAGSPADALAALRAVIQDPAASAVVDCLGDGLRPLVYDACAAPGTKTMGLAARSSGPVVAADVSRRRLERVRASAGRLGVEILPVVADGRRPAVGSAATVLADVPCTGTGVLRRRPDARWRIGPESLGELVSLQADILDGCAEIVDEGGTLVYSTCSLEPEENEMQVEAFLRRTPGFQRDELDSRAFPGGAITASGDLFVRPWVHGTDGSYAARLRRVA